MLWEGEIGIILKSFIRIMLLNAAIFLIAYVVAKPEVASWHIYAGGISIGLYELMHNH